MNQTECVFCHLATLKDIHIWDNQDYFAIKDKFPKAKTHLLVIPKAHVVNIDEATDGQGLLEAIQEVAKVSGIAGGYSLRSNVGAEGGQEVMHLHAHLLSPRETN